MREHELQLALINAFARDPELKYYIGMAAGTGVAWVGQLLNSMSSPTASTGGAAEPGQIWTPWGPVEASGTFTTEEQAAAVKSAKDVTYGWLALNFGGVSGLAAISALDWTGGSSGGLSGQIGNILALGGTGFAGTCAMILILKAIFSGTDLGELLSGVGEIIPL